MTLQYDKKRSVTRMAASAAVAAALVVAALQTGMVGGEPTVAKAAPTMEGAGAGPGAPKAAAVGAAKPRLLAAGQKPMPRNAHQPPFAPKGAASKPAGKPAAPGQPVIPPIPPNFRDAA